MTLKSELETAYQEHVSKMEKLAIYKKALRQLGLDGVNAVGQALDEIAQTSIGTQLLSHSTETIEIGEGTAIIGAAFSVDGAGGLQLDRQHYCLELKPEDYLIARPVVQPSLNSEIYVVPSFLPERKGMAQSNAHLRFFLRETEFRCESFSGDRDGKAAEDLLETLGAAFLRQKLGQPIAPEGIADSSIITAYEFRREKLDKMILEGVKKTLYEIEK